MFKDAEDTPFEVTMTFVLIGPH